MATLQRTRQYSDLDLNFIAHPVTKDIIPRTGDAAVVSSVKNLIYTNFYERPFQSHVGSGVRGLMFENITSGTAIALRTAIELVLANFEPRVEVESVSVIPDYDHNRFQVILTFFIVNQSAPVTISLFLERVR